MRRRKLPILAAAGLLAALAGAPKAQATIAVSQAREFAPRQLVVKFAGERSGRLLALPPGVGVQRSASALRRNPHIEYAEPNYIATASAAGLPFTLPDDPGTLEGGAEAAVAGGWAQKQWNFLPWEAEPASRLPASPGGIDAPAAWSHLAEFGHPGASGVTVAVLDTGIAFSSLGGEFAPSPDFTRNQFVQGSDFVDGGPPLDENGHGTHIAGTIGEKTGNGIGLTGLAYGAKLMPVRVLDSQGRGTAIEIADGIRFAVAHHAEVINMSFNFGCERRVPGVDEALRQAYQHGIVTVASAGNLGSETCVSEPATGPRVIAVSGTTEGGCLGNYSLGSTEIDLVAPGGGEPAAGCPSVLSRPIYQVTLEPGSTRTFGIPNVYVGTSMAAAHVSGVAAMVLAIGHRRSRAKALTPTHVVYAVTSRLQKTARDIGLPRTEQGAGLLDADRATKRTLLLR